MILKGSQRSGALKLAAHLTRLDENDHVEVHELRSFTASDLRGALQEIEAIAKGTRCKQSLFSLSLNPPATEQVPITAFEAAIENIEEKLDLSGQARAIVFHEKEGRRHEVHAQEAQMRDAYERESLISKQLEERQLVQRDVRKMKRDTSRRMEALRQEVAFYLGMREQEPFRQNHQRSYVHSRSPDVSHSREL